MLYFFTFTEFSTEFSPVLVRFFFSVPQNSYRSHRCFGVRSSNGTNMSQQDYHIPNGIHATVGAICFGVLTLHKNQRVLLFVSLSSSCIWLSRNGIITFCCGFLYVEKYICQVEYMFILPSETHTSARNRRKRASESYAQIYFKSENINPAFFHCPAIVISHMLN